MSPLLPTSPHDADGEALAHAEPAPAQDLSEVDLLALLEAGRYDDEATAGFRVGPREVAGATSGSYGAMRRVDQLVLWMILLVPAAVVLLVDRSHPAQLIPLVAVSLFVFATSGPGLRLGQYTLQGADKPRHAHVIGTWLVVHVESTWRCYDLRSAVVSHHGDWTQVRQARGRWVADLVPTALFERITEETSPSSLNDGGTVASGGVALGTSWRESLVRLTLVLSATGPWLAGSLALLLLALASFVVSEGVANFGLVWTCFWTFMFCFMSVGRLLGTRFDLHRGIRIGANRAGLWAGDDGYVELVAWSGNPVRRVSDDAMLLARPLRTCVHRPDTEAEAFEQLAARVEQHSVARHGGARPGAGMSSALALHAAAGALVATLVGPGVGAIAAMLTHPVIVGIVVSSMVLPVVHLAVRIALTPRPPLSESRPPPARRRLSVGGLLAGSALLIAPCALVLAIVLPAYHHPDAAGVAAWVACAAFVALLAARSADDIRLVERLLAITIGVSVCSGLLLLGAWHHLLDPAVRAATVTLLLLAALLVAVTLVSRVRAPEYNGRRRPALALVPVAVTTSLLAAGLGVHQVDSDTMVDGGAPQDALHSELVSHVRVNSTPLAQAWDDAFVFDVRWNASGARLERVGTLPSSDDPLAGAVGQRAVGRIEALLGAARTQPGRDPAVSRVVLTRSEAASIVHDASAGMDSRPMKPAEVARWLDDRFRPRTASAREARYSRYYERSRTIVIAPETTRDLLPALRARPGSTLTDDGHVALGVFLHELEHSMTSFGPDPKWITEATAEVLPSWRGVTSGYAAAIGVKLPAETFASMGEYGEWSHLLDYLLWRCDLTDSQPRSRDAVLRLLRRPGTESLIDAVADCLVATGSASVDRDELVGYLVDADDDDGREALYDVLPWED